MVSKVLFAIVIFAFICHINCEENAAEEESGPVEYEFHYAVHDDHTKDIKSHREHRKNDVVEGLYDLIDSDGFKRIVEYKANDHDGFTAVVRREPTDIKVPIPEVHVAEASVAESIQHPIVHYAKIVPAPAKIIVPAAKVVARAAPVYHHNQPYTNHVSFRAPNVVYHY